MLTLVMLAVLLPQVAVNHLGEFQCEVDGQKWVSRVTGEQLRAAPHWTMEGPVPLPPDGAIRSARQILAVMVEQVTGWHVDCVELMSIAGSWVYRVQFGEVSPRPGMRQRQLAEVFVRLDGTGIIPTRTDTDVAERVSPIDVSPSTGEVRTDIGRPDRREPTSAEEVKPLRSPVSQAPFTGADGRRWNAAATMEQVVATPRWTTDGPVPLPPEGAVRSAERLFPVVGMQLEDWRVISVELRRVGDQSWVYTVGYLEWRSKHADAVQQAWFLVLLDGTGITPTLRRE
jgi:hypothetical protein